jgi:hypothetical protein
MGTSTSIMASPGLTGDATRGRRPSPAALPAWPARVHLRHRPGHRLLDGGHSGLLIVAAQDTEARLDEAIKDGNKIVKKQLRSDEKDLEPALNEAIRESKG